MVTMWTPRRFSGSGAALFSLIGLSGCPNERVGTDDEVGDTATESDDDTTTSSTGEATDTDTDVDTSESETGDPECGNGAVEADEECDDGNDVDDDGCSNACTLPTCGDGIVQAGEGCDAGADNGPGMPCNSMCQPNTCGDGELGPGEGCDDGNMIDDDECSNECALPTCGNGQLDVGEECDDGNDLDDDECLNSCVAASCGDGVLFPQDEACDQGALNSDTAECTSACQQAVCGDGLVWNGMEECDLGANNGPMSACLESCIENVCGDGFQSPEEGCDDGNLDDDDGCSSSCELEGCGDGIVQAGEECDDANDDDTDSCTTLCQVPACGDGFLQAGEECDQGNANADDDECTLACTTAECGDGLVQAGVEQCDNGDANANNASCKADCTDNYCGDGFAGPGEACDDGNASNADACTTVCTAATCGDGFVQPGEQCDDDDAVNDDECTNACTLPACGDDIVQVGEGCDEGIGNGGNAACNPECEIASCGDGYVYAMGGEECDDADFDNVDACTNACTNAECGDGIVQAGVDECDDGNLLGNDGCSAGCVEQNVLQVSSGTNHTCALLDTGAVRCWGVGAGGKLGYANTFFIGDDEHPFSAGDVNVGGPVVQIAAGYDHTCALLDTGAVRCWGNAAGGWGTLGYGNNNSIGDDEHPATAGDVSIGGTVVQLATGRDFTCALLQGGAVRCWGAGSLGRLGYGNSNNIGDNELPSSVGPVNVGGVVTQIAAGEEHVCVVLVGGTVRCWGSGFNGKLGYGSQNHIGDNEQPATAGNVDVGGTVTQIACEHHHTCARLDNGAVRCWGDGSDGRLGYGNQTSIGDNELPAVAGNVSVGGAVAQLDVGSLHTCARLDSGAIRCWGFNDFGQLGYGNGASIGDNELPSTAGNVNFGGIATHVTTGERHVCVILDTGALRCWGRGSYGQLGYANTNNIGDNELPFTAGNVQVF
jgi:cysteine-rich repeat protein